MLPHRQKGEGIRPAFHKLPIRGADMKDQKIKAILRAPTALLIALASVSPMPGRVREIFGTLISRAVNEERQPTRME
jgi:hypothetical protein